MGRDELRRALNEAADGPERDFTGTWAQGRRVRRRRQTAQGLGVVAVAAAAVGVFTLGGGNLLGEDATIEPLPPATQTLTTEQVTEATTEADATEDATSEAVTDEPTTEGAEAELPGPNDPLPTTVEDYVRVYLAAGMAGDEVLLERMGTDGALEASVTWTELTLLLDEPRVSDGVDAGEDNVYVLAEGPFAVVLSVDRAAAEAGEDDAVLHGESIDAPASMTPGEYADLVVELWLEGAFGPYATNNVVETLDQVPTDGTWERTGSSEDGDVVVVTYENAAVEGELVLTVDPVRVELREYAAVVDASYTGEAATTDEPSVPPGDGDQPLPVEGEGAQYWRPCDTPWPVPAVQDEGLGPVPANTAQLLLGKAATCDVDGIIAMAEADGTKLPGGVTPDEFFAGPKGERRVHAIAIQMAQFRSSSSFYPEGIEPKDAMDLHHWISTQDDNLDLLVELELFSPAEAQEMRDAGSFPSWHVGILEDGTWLEVQEFEVAIEP